MSFIKKFNLSYFKYLILSAMMMILFGLSVVGIEKDEYGVYLIKTEADLREFAYIVNGTHKNIAQDREANAILVNDINIIDPETQEGEYLSQIIEDGKDNRNEEKQKRTRKKLSVFNFIPIGVEESCSYQGDFNGNGKTITGLYAEIIDGYNESVYSGLFGVIGDEGEVRDIYLKNAYVISVFNKYKDDLRSSRYESIIDDINNYIYSGAICGENNGKIVGCTVFGVVSMSTVGRGINKIKNYTYSGAICGKNNGEILDYKVLKADSMAVKGKENHGGDIVGENRGKLLERHLEKDENGVYLIKTSDDLREFANKVNGGETMAHATLVEDIVLLKGEELPKVNGPYGGCFDGNNKKIDYAGLGSFGLFEILLKEGEVKYLTVCNVIGYRGGTKTWEYDYKGNGLIVDYNLGKVSDCKVENCKFLQVYTGENVGALVGVNKGEVSNSSTVSLEIKEVLGSNITIGGNIGRSVEGLAVGNVCDVLKISGDIFGQNIEIGGNIGISERGDVLYNICEKIEILKNINVMDINESKINIGGNVGCNELATIDYSICKEIKILSEIMGQRIRIGGNVGYNNGGEVKNSGCKIFKILEGVNKPASVGRVVGLNYNGNVKSCYYVKVVGKKILGVGKSLRGTSSNIKGYSEEEIEEKFLSVFGEV